MTTTMRCVLLATLLWLLATPAQAVPWPMGVHPDDLGTRTGAAVEALAAGLPAAQREGYAKLVADGLAAGADSPQAALGVTAFMNQQLDAATWLYGQAVLADPKNAVFANNFAVALHEKALLADGGTDPALLQLARDHLAAALHADPDNAGYLANFGFAEFERWKANKDAATLADAVRALQRAVELDDASPTAWAHLAEALFAKGDESGAAQALANARSRSPLHGAVLAAGKRLPAMVVSEASSRTAAVCEIDYGCDANCPRSIIGQIDLVTCRIAESSAQSACAEGRAFAPAFDCAEKIPEFGILIPGLNSGFSMPTPFGRLDVTVDGAGNVDYRFKWSANYGAAGGEVTARGSWSPESGFSEVEVKPGVTYSLVGGEAARALQELEMGPAQIGLEGQPGGNVEIKVEVYGGSVFSH